MHQRGVKIVLWASSRAGIDCSALQKGSGVPFFSLHVDDMSDADSECSQSHTCIAWRCGTWHGHLGKNSAFRRIVYEGINYNTRICEPCTSSERSVSQSIRIRLSSQSTCSA